MSCKFNVLAETGCFFKVFKAEVFFSVNLMKFLQINFDVFKKQMSENKQNRSCN